MRILIVDDDQNSARLLATMMRPFGECDLATDGRQAIDNVKVAYREDDPYDLICLDIMMPNIDGQRALQAIREYEEKRKVPFGRATKIMMVTALSDTYNMIKAFVHLCDAYIAKPIEKKELIEKLEQLGLIN